MRNLPAKSWKRWIAAIALFTIVCRPALAAPEPGAGGGPDDALSNDPVDKAIKKAVGWLKSKEKGGNWEAVPRRTMEEGYKVEGAQWGGLTAMAVYALLAAGEPSQKPPVSTGMAWLDGADVIGTYAMGMKLQSWNYVHTLSDAQRKVLKKDATLLMNGVKTGAGNMGLYHYWVDPAKGDWDASCSNYGVLGMWAAGQQNLEVPPAYWEMVDKAWRKNQQKDGSWSYHNAPPGTMALTPAGVATLFITQEMLGEGRGGDCKGNIIDEDIKRGIDWMSKHFNEAGNNHYALYNVERVGTASGYKYFGTVDWYKDGAAKLVATQKPDGSWDGSHGGAIPSTVWAILFLVKGRAPVMMNKLDYTIDFRGDKSVTNWNQRPRDIANLAHWAGSKTLEKDLNWQIVNLKVNSDDLHDSPVLYISGNQGLNFSKDDKEKLKQYVEAGGLVLGHADCMSPVFSQSFIKLGQDLFPQSEFRELPPDHLIYSVHFNRKTWPANFNPGVRGLSNGARELMLLLPAHDPGRYWQIQNFSSQVTKPMAELATNIYLYAVDKTSLASKFKGQSYIIDRDEKTKAERVIKVARLEYGNTWNPEPGGWRRLDNDMHNSHHIDVTTESVKLGDGKLKADAFPIAHLTGAVKFHLNAKQQAELKKYAEDGGTLVIDAAGGAVDFKDAMENELGLIFGAAAKNPNVLPADHPIYSGGGQKVSKVAYRAFARKLLGNIATPRLRGIEVNNRLAVIYSPEDLSVGMVGMSIDGIYGYDATSATKVMESIIMYAAKGAAPVAGGAANAAPGEARPAAEKLPADAPKPDPKKEVKPAAPAKAAAGGAKPAADPKKAAGRK